MKKRLIALLCAIVMVAMIVPQVFATENSGEVRLAFFYIDEDNMINSYSYLLEQSDLPYTVPTDKLNTVNGFVRGDFDGKWYRDLECTMLWQMEPITETTYLYAPGYDRESIEYYVKVEFNYDTVGMDDNWDKGDLQPNENEMLEDVFEHENSISSVNDEIERIKNNTEKIFGGWYTSENFKPETKIDPKNFYINEQTVNYIKDSMGYLTVYAKWLDPAHVEKASLLPEAQAKFSSEEIRVRFIWDLINPDGETITSIGAYLIPFSLFDKGDIEKGQFTNVNNPQIDNGQTFSADIIVTEEYKDSTIYAIPFVNGRINEHAVISTTATEADIDKPESN